MDKIYENSADLHVVSTIIYDHNDGKAYIDEDCTVQFKTSELKEAFLKGAVIKMSSGDFVKPTRYTESSDLGSVVYVKPNSTTATKADLASLTSVYDEDLDLVVDVDIDAITDLLGKVVGDLQSGVLVRDNDISGVLKYVTGYTGFSGDVAEQSGNYLATHSSVKNVDGATITVTNTLSGRVVTLDPDGLLITRVVDKYATKLTFTVSKENYRTLSRTYTLYQLVCERT